jgi:hypothetical protein
MSWNHGFMDQLGHQRTQRQWFASCSCSTRSSFTPHRIHSQETRYVCAREASTAYKPLSVEMGTRPIWFSSLACLSIATTGSVIHAMCNHIWRSHCLLFISGPVYLTTSWTQLEAGLSCAYYDYGADLIKSGYVLINVLIYWLWLSRDMSDPIRIQWEKPMNMPACHDDMQ